MGDANEKKKNKKTKYKNRNYTDLSDIYRFKTLCFFVISILTILFAKTFESTLIGLLTTLTGIGFDLYIISKSNCGPKQKIQRELAKIAKDIIVVICTFVILYFIIKTTITIPSNIQKNIKYICKGVIVIFAFIGPITEFYFNKPENNVEGRD